MWKKLPDREFEDLCESVVQRVRLQQNITSETFAWDFLKKKKSDFWYLGLAVGGNLLKRGFLELLHHLTPPLPLLLLQTSRIWKGKGQLCAPEQKRAVSSCTEPGRVNILPIAFFKVSNVISSASCDCRRIKISPDRINNETTIRLTRSG